jgi:U3 small nucleolar RNA-associated protein 12
MGISNDGKFVITGSHDKSMRLWEKTNEPLILEDERETVTKLNNSQFY